MKTIHSLCIIACSILTASFALASPITITQKDTAYNWPGWSSPAVWNTSVNSIDHVGVPDILTTSFTIDSGYLKSISINMSITNATDWAAGIVPGDFFLNTNLGNGNIWDYEIHNPSNLSHSSSVPTTTNQWNVYNQEISYANQAKDASNYINSTVYTKNTSGWIWRTNEPIQARISNDAQSLLMATLSSSYNGTTLSSAWPKQNNVKPGLYTVTWDFGGSGIDLRNVLDFSYGFTVSCANDVVYGTIELPARPAGDPPVATPEPCTLLLMGVGITGAVYFRRKTKLSA